MGHWIERDPGYLSYDVYNCEYCGKMIPRRIWIEIDGEGRSHAYCDEKCALRLAKRTESEATTKA